MDFKEKFNFVIGRIVNLALVFVIAYGCPSIFFGIYSHYKADKAFTAKCLFVNEVGFKEFPAQDLNVDVILKCRRLGVEIYKK